MFDSETLPLIDAPRVSLRSPTDADIPSLFAVFSDPEVMRYWSSLPLAHIEEASQLLEKMRDNFRRRALFQWGIARKADDRLIGTCTLFHVDEAHRRAELGYALGREYWGQGYMREALCALLDFWFGHLNMHRIEADVDPRNAASVKTLERLGFQKEGYLRERWHVGGEIQDAFFYGLLRSEWRNLPGAL